MVLLEILISLILVVISTIVIAKACDGFEAAADYLGRNLSEGVKGASINAIGSSMPELFTTFVFLFLFADTTGFAGGLGATAGSAVFNAMIIPAFSILVVLKLFSLAAINVSKKVVLRDGLMLIAAELLLILTMGDTLQWWHGVMLMLFYLFYIAYMFWSMKRVPGAADSDENGADAEEEDDEDDNTTKSRLTSLLTLDLEFAVIGKNEMRTGNGWALLIAATTVIALACYLLVYGCEQFGEAMGIEGYFVAVIIAAAASSIPDTILSIRDAKKGNYDDAVSNALGSNIFDICFALGLPLFIYTIIYGDITIPTVVLDDIVELRILLLFLTVAAFLVFFLGRGLGKGKAYGLLAMYVLFVTYIVGRAYEQRWVEPAAEFLHSVQGFISSIQGLI